MSLTKEQINAASYAFGRVEKFTTNNDSIDFMALGKIPVGILFLGNGTIQMKTVDSDSFVELEGFTGLQLNIAIAEINSAGTDVNFHYFFPLESAD